MGASYSVHGTGVGILPATGMPDSTEVLVHRVGYHTDTGGTRIRIPLFHRGWITPVLGVCRYSDRSHFEGTAAVCITSEGFRLEFPSA